MTDRELLERAAKAAGIFLTPEKLAEVFPLWEWEDGFEPRHLDGGGMSGTVVEYSYSGELSGTTREEWHPLTDDGDAFRLAVKLRLGLEWWKNGVGAESAQHGPGVIHHLEDDPYATTRRAIVRAAAEMAGDAGAVPDKSDLPEDNYYKDQAEAFYGVEKK